MFMFSQTIITKQVRIIEWLISSFTSLDSTRQENMLLFVQLEASSTVILPTTVSFLWFRFKAHTLSTAVWGFLRRLLQHRDRNFSIFPKHATIHCGICRPLWLVWTSLYPELALSFVATHLCLSCPTVSSRKQQLCKNNVDFRKKYCRHRDKILKLLTFFTQASVPLVLMLETRSPTQALKQCDQMARFFNMWPFAAMKVCPKA